MRKQVKTRALAIAVAALCAASATSAGVATLGASAAYSSSILKSLVTSIGAVDSEGNSYSTNEEECTFKCIATEDIYGTTLFTDTMGTGPATLLGTSTPKYIDFHFQLPEEYYNDGYVVSKLVWYFGCAATKDYDYWYDTKNSDFDSVRGDEQPECHPCTNEFDLYVAIPSYADLSDESGKFQIQNCYTEMAKINDDGTIEHVQDAVIELVSVTAASSNSGDTSEASEEEQAKYVYVEGQTTIQNTGALWYSSILSSEYNNETLKHNGDSGTFGSLRTLRLGPDAVTEMAEEKYDSSELVITPGTGYSEEDYLDALGNEIGEEFVRKNGDPLNSHKFSYGEFDIEANTNASNEVHIKSISVTLEPTNSDITTITRLMYGGGINVLNRTPADTNYMEATAGIIDESNSNYENYLSQGSYWYNDVGSDAWEDVLAWQEANPGEYVFHEIDANGNHDWTTEFTVESGVNLVDQDLGTYFTITWDVPEAVQPYTSTNISNNDSISLQMWYAEGTTADGEKITSNDSSFGGFRIVDAAITYEEDLTLAEGMKDATSSKSYSGTVGDAVEIPYADFNMEYDCIADIYAVEADVTLNGGTTSQPVVIYGAGTSTLEDCGYWYELDDQYDKCDLAFLNWTASTRDDGTRDSNPVYTTAEGRSTFELSWLIEAPIQKHISTELDGDKLQLGVWWAGDTATNSNATGYTLTNVKVYYLADDWSNTYKIDLLEGDFSVSPTEMCIATIDNVVYLVETDESGNPVYDEETGYVVTLGEASFDTTVAVSSAMTSGRFFDLNSSVVMNEAGTHGTIAYIKSGYEGYSGTITLTTRLNQTAVINVTVVEAIDPNWVDDDEEPTVVTATLYGDVDLDGSINMADVILLNRAVSGSILLSEQQIANANVAYDLDDEGNDNVDTDDSQKLLLFQIGLESHLGPDI